MSLFPNLRTDATVQVDDKLRLDASGSFKTDDEAAITAVEIEPDSGAGFVDVFDASEVNNWFLDFAYSTGGTKTISVRLTSDGAPVTKTFSVEVLSVADDALFSTDQDIIQSESEIHRFLPDGRNSYLYVHREAQRLILADLNQRGIRKNDGSKLDKTDILDSTDVREWSKYLTLKMIFMDISDREDDVFMQKCINYGQKAFLARDSFIAIDFNDDGEKQDNEELESGSTELVRW